MIEANRRVSIFVGALMVTVGVTLAALLIFLGSATRIFAKKVHVSACFSDVTGLRTGASVVVAGVTVGTVDRVALGGGCGNDADVGLALDKDAAGRLAADSRAKLVTMGLLGDRLVAIVPGKAAGRLHDRQVIAGEVPPDATAVIAEARNAFQLLTHIAQRLDEQLASVDLKGALEDVGKSARSLSSLLARAEHGPGLLHLLVYDRTLARQARAVGPALQHVAAAADGAKQTMGQLQHAATDVSDIVAYIKSGQGTLGGVIYDPAIYEDLRLIVGKVRRNVVLRTLGRFVLKHR